MTSTSQAQTIVVMASIGTVAVTTISALTAGKTPPARTFVGGLVMAVGLSTLATWQPGVASGLAGVVLITALFSKGAGAWTGIARTASPAQPTKTNPAQRTNP